VSSIGRRTLERKHRASDARIPNTQTQSPRCNIRSHTGNSKIQDRTTKLPIRKTQNPRPKLRFQTNGIAWITGHVRITVSIIFEPGRSNAGSMPRASTLFSHLRGRVWGREPGARRGLYRSLLGSSWRDPMQQFDMLPQKPHARARR